MSTQSKSRGDLLTGLEYKDIPKRGLTEETCRKWRYGFGEMRDGTRVQVAQYVRDGQVVAQKTRTKDKDFSFLGDTKGSGLFGQHLWEGSNARKLIITEGEIDAMSVSQVQGHKWPVVSVPNGAQGAAKSIAKSIDFVSRFEEVILMFDQDDPGREGAEAAAQIIPVGHVKIAELPLKDPNELLVQGRGEEIIQAIWRAKEYRPDGIVSIDDILEDIRKPIDWGIPWFMDTLTKLTYGRRYGEIYAFGAGTGIGKTDLMTQQMSYDIEVLGEHVGVIYLEQKPSETGKRLAGKMEGQRFHVPDAGWTQDQMETAIGKLRGKVHFYDNFGQTDWDIVKNHIRYMAVGLGIRLFYLDHLTAMADTSNEKESIEQMMKEMAGLAQELNIIIHFVSHLSTPKDGKPHEEGGRVMIQHFKGSRSIGFWSFFMFGLERDQQHEDRRWRSITTFRVLKDRYTGTSAGEVIYLGYDPDTGKLFETEAPSDADGAADFPDDYQDF